MLVQFPCVYFLLNPATPQSHFSEKVFGCPSQNNKRISKWRYEIRGVKKYKLLMIPLESCIGFEGFDSYSFSFLHLCLRLILFILFILFILVANVLRVCSPGWPSYLSLLSAGISGVHHHTWFPGYF
jgi:hypothetical protein